MAPDNSVAPLHFSAPRPQVTDQFVEGCELPFRRRPFVEIASKTNAERDVVQVIRGHVSAVNLASPAGTDFDLAIVSAAPVANHEMIRESVLHVPCTPMVIIVGPCIARGGAAVVDDDVFPASAPDGRPVNGSPQSF